MADGDGDTAAPETPRFYRYSQDLALTTFPPILERYLPQSNPLYNRLQAPHNLPSRHCIFAASFAPPPSGSPSPASTPDNWTIIFSDRSRHSESQVWIFNPLVTVPTPLINAQQVQLSSHIQAAIHFLRDTAVPEAPGWPFSPLVRFACSHETITATIKLLYGRIEGAIPYITVWNLWAISTTAIVSRLSSQANGIGRGRKEERRALPRGYKVSRVPDDQLDIVVSTSSIRRQPSTLKLQPSVGIVSDEGRLVAWGYIGIDGHMATLYVLPEYRGRGWATLIAEELLARLNAGEFSDIGYQGKSGWVLADVAAGNLGSEGVMKSLGGSIRWQTSYLWVDCEKI